MIINIPIFENFDIYSKIFPGKDAQTFNEHNSPIFQAIIASKIDVGEEKKLRFCIINNKFEDFVKKNNFEDLKSALKTYVDNITDEEAENLWQSSEQTKYVIKLMVYPFLIMTEKIDEVTNFTLSDEQALNLKKLISSSSNIKEDDIYIPKYIGTFQKLMEYGHTLYSLGEDYFFNNKIIKYPLFEEQENPDGFGVYLYGIPIFINEKLNYTMNEDVLKSILGEDIKENDLDFENLKSIIKIKDFLTVPLTHYLVFLEDLSNVYDDVCKLIDKGTKMRPKKEKNKKGLFKFFNRKNKD